MAGSRFSPDRSGNPALEGLSRATGDVLEQLEDARRGLLVGTVVSTHAAFQLGEQLLVKYTGPRAQTFTLARAAIRGPGRGLVTFVANDGGGVLTLAAAGKETVNGVASVTLEPGQSAILTSDGASTWHATLPDPGFDLATLAGLGLSVNAGGDGLDNDFATGINAATATLIGSTQVAGRLAILGSTSSNGFVDFYHAVTMQAANSVTPNLTLWSRDAGADSGHARLTFQVTAAGSSKYANINGDANGDLYFECAGNRQRFSYGGSGTDHIWLEFQAWSGGPTTTFRTNDVERFSINNGGDVVVGAGALSTTATDGFLFIPSGAGPPTGTPNTRTGRVPLYVDAATPTLWIFIGGTWRSAALA